jgi:hypothetical protein
MLNYLGFFNGKETFIIFSGGKDVRARLNGFKLYNLAKAIVRQFEKEEKYKFKVGDYVKVIKVIKTKGISNEQYFHLKSYIGAIGIISKQTIYENKLFLDIIFKGNNKEVFRFDEIIKI